MNYLQELTECTAQKRQNSDQDIQYASITDQEISMTFGRGSNTPGPDGACAQLIDKAERSEMSKCLSLLWNEV